MFSNSMGTVNNYRDFLNWTKSIWHCNLAMSLWRPGHTMGRLERERFLIGQALGHWLPSGLHCSGTCGWHSTADRSVSGRKLWDCRASSCFQFICVFFGVAAKQSSSHFYFLASHFLCLMPYLPTLMKS